MDYVTQTEATATETRAAKPAVQRDEHRREFADLLSGLSHEGTTQHTSRDVALNVPDPIDAQPERREPAEKPPAKVEAAKPQPVIDACPHCKCRLSAFEIKMSNCMSCGRGWSADSRDGARKAISVGL